MQRNTLFSILATAALGLVMAGPVSAKTTNWESGDATNPERWHEDNNWSNGIPAAGDTVNINTAFKPVNYQDPVLSTDDGAAGTVTIGSDFSLTVTGRTLTLDGATQTFNGNLILSDSTAKVEFTVDVTVDGDGEIVGQHNDAEIRIANDKTLTNEMIISGKMTILDAGTSGTFKNGPTGIVRANANGILLLDGSLRLDDDNDGDARPKWQAQSNSGAVLRFESGLTFVDSSPQLVGNFLVDDDATLDIDLTIVTSGTMTHTNGTVDTTVNTSIFFKATGNDPDFLCNTICVAP